ncbi:hypothetical protein [Chryseobacterium sp.]|uniref:hypothetical protein n=1 Tax=Chryseobacterium sp. TaxID=1871047 RepID=UPI0028A0A566|nr:hypothetical protein [Chryseobacterium sp.]
MKTLLYFFFSLLTISVSGQDGINTATPEVTLDIVRKSSVPNHYDWLIPPCITGDQLPEKIYSVPKKQTLLFVTLPAYVLSGQLINVAEPGLYYFDGSLWQTCKTVPVIWFFYRGYSHTASGWNLCPESVNGIPSRSSP